MPRWAGLGAELWFSMRTGQSYFHAWWGNVFHGCDRSWEILARGVGPRQPPVRILVDRARLIDRTPVADHVGQVHANQPGRRQCDIGM